MTRQGSAWRGSAACHLDLDVHFDEVVRRSVIGTLQRESLERLACHGDADQVGAADLAVGRIELDPAGAGQVDLDPGMGIAGAADLELRYSVV